MDWASMPEAAVAEDRQTNSRESYVDRASGSDDGGKVNAESQARAVKTRADLPFARIVAPPRPGHSQTCFNG